MSFYTQLRERFMSVSIKIDNVNNSESINEDQTTNNVSNVKDRN